MTLTLRSRNRKMERRLYGEGDYPVKRTRGTQIRGTGEQRLEDGEQ